MLYSLIPISLLVLVTLLLGTVLRKTFSELFAPSLFSVMLILYGSYIFDALIIGRWIVIGLCVLMAVTLGALVLRDPSRKDALAKQVKAPAFSFFLVAFLLFFLFAAGEFVNLWDSLRLWGAYPKVLHTTQALQLGEASVLYPSMQSYPPGMPLLCYFFTSFSPVFPESVLFLTYSLFGLSMMLPLLEGVSGCSKKAQLWVFWGIIFIPWFISSVNDDFAQYYSSLFIDIPLGICCGYSFFLAFRRFGNGTLENIQFLLACGCVALLKDSGSFIAVCCVAGALVSCILRRKEIRFTRAILWLLASAAVMLFVWRSWGFLRDQSAIANHLQLGFTVPPLSVLVRIAYRFLVTPASSPLLPIGNFSVSLPFALVFIFAVKLLLCRYGEKQRMKLEIFDILIQAVCYGAFFVGYCLIFLEQIQEGVYPSYSRYMNTLLISAVYILTADCIFRHQGILSDLFTRLRTAFSGEDAPAKLVRAGGKVLRLVVLAASVMALLMTLIDRQDPSGPLYVQARKTAAAAVEKIPASSEEPYTDIFLCITGDDESNYRLHHRIYFELIDDDIRVVNYFDELDITDPSLGYTPDSFMDRLIDGGIDYVLLPWTSEALRENFAELVPEEGYDLVYRIDAENRALVLVP